MEIKNKIPEHIEVIDVSSWSKGKWLAYRLTGLGCSEIGTALGYNDYETSGELFYRKVGITDQSNKDNLPMFFGRVLEDHIRSLWKAYDWDNPSEQNTLENIANNIVLRDCYSSKAYYRNPKYPWLFGGPDGLFLHNNELSVLEIKTIGSWAADKYDGLIPPSYIYQIHAYMLLFECDYW